MEIDWATKMRALTDARIALALIDDDLLVHLDDAGLAIRTGRCAGAAEVAADAIFNVLNTLWSYLENAEAKAEIDRYHEALAEIRAARASQ